MSENNCELPTKVGTVTVRVSRTGSVRMRWDTLGALEEFTYNVFISKDGGEFELDGTTFGAGYSMRNLDAGSYEVYVIASNSCGNGPASDSVTFTIA